MEQLKPFIDGCKKHQFWIFCGATLIACFAVYYIARGGFAQKEAEFTKKIESAFNKAKKNKSAGVPIDPENKDSNVIHPNNGVIKSMKDMLVVAATETRKAWLQNYSAQQSFQVFEKDLIGAPATDFRQYLPAEKNPFVADDEAELLPEPVRVDYRDKIKQVLPTLAGLVGSAWKPALQQGAATPDEVVIWSKSNQETWNERFTNFVDEWNTDEDRNVPHTLQVLYTSEDIWALRNILQNVIAKTVNSKGDVYANDLAVIKQIDHIVIGKGAEEPLEKENNGSAGSTMGAMGGSGAMSSPTGMGEMGGGGQMTGGAMGATKNNQSAKEKIDPAYQRYVDNDGKEISPNTYRSLYSSTTTDSKKVHLKIRKRLKVRIGLQMDSREIETLLANCANAPFPIEVVQLRVNKHKGNRAAAAGGGAAGAGGAAGSGGAMSSAGGSSAAGGMAGVGAASGGGSSGGAGGMGGKNSSGEKAMAIDDQGYTQPVEIYGYMYIYNNVDESVFKILKETQNPSSQP